MTSPARAHRPEVARAAALLASLVPLLLALLAAAGCGGGGDDDAPPAATTAPGGAPDLGAAVADAAEAGRSGGGITDGIASGGTDGGGSATTTSTEAYDESAARDLPAPSFPASSPPTTVEGMEAVSIPGAAGDDPIFGQLIVDLEPGGYLDLPTHLRRGQHVQVLSSADDGIRSRTTVFAPDGTTVGQWESSGRPGDIVGYYWDDDDVLPADGTYVFRVEHLGGADNPFVLAFYGEK
jgi:hypothetical protein